MLAMRPFMYMLAVEKPASEIYTGPERVNKKVVFAKSSQKCGYRFRARFEGCLAMSHYVFNRFVATNLFLLASHRSGFCSR